MHKYEHLKDIPLFSTIIVLMFGVFGAVFNYSKRRIDIKQRSTKEKIFLFFVDLITSGGFSLLTFYGALGFGLNEPISVMLSGVVAYQGTNALYYAELFVANKFGDDTIVEAIKEKDKENKND